MKTNSAFRLMVVATILLFATLSTQAQNATDAKTKTVSPMKTFLIERDIPNAGKLTPLELKGISQTSCAVLKDMGPQIEWIQSYVTGNKIVCVYKAESEELIREHGKKGGFPVTSVTEISNTISPATARQ